MTQQNWPEYGIGFVMAHAYKNGGECEYESLVNAMGYDNVNSLIEDKEHDSHTWRFYDKGGEIEGKTFHDLNGDVSYPDEMLVIWAKKWNGINPFGATYSCPDEIIEEFLLLIGMYLPENFDWNAHIGEFSCSIYC